MSDYWRDIMGFYVDPDEQPEPPPRTPERRKPPKERPVTQAQLRFMQAIDGRPIRRRDRIFFRHPEGDRYIAWSSVSDLITKGLVCYTAGYECVELTDAGRDALRESKEGANDER